MPKFTNGQRLLADLLTRNETEEQIAGRMRNAGKVFQEAANLFTSSASWTNDSALKSALNELAAASSDAAAFLTAQNVQELPNYQMPDTQGAISTYERICAPFLL